MTKRRKSVATSSLRLRPVCNFQPSAPSSWTSALSTKWCTSSAVEERSNDGSWPRCFAMLSSASSVSCNSAAEKTPMPCSALAHARSTANSYGSRRRSTENERWKASKRLSGSRSKRPPQRRSSLRSVISTRVGRDGYRIDGLVSSRVTLGFGSGAYGYRQREKIDEAFGVFGIVAAHGEAGEVRAIEGEGRDAFGDGERAFPKLEAHGAGDTLL